MKIRKRTRAESDALMQEAEAFTNNNRDSWLALDKVVQAIREPKRPPPGWKAPELTIDPAQFARQSVKNAVIYGQLAASFPESKRLRSECDEIKRLAEAAQDAKMALQRLLAELDTVHDSLGNEFFNAVWLADGGELHDQMYCAMETADRITVEGKREAKHRAKHIAHDGDLFRQGFTLEMATVYFLLTGLIPPETRNDASPFVLFVDAAMHAISKDEVSCVGVLRKVIRRFRLELSDGLIDGRIRKLWVTPVSYPDPYTNFMNDEPSPR